MALESIGRDAMALRHHSLVAWQRADDLFISLHRLSLQAFPAYERFELGSQLRRAAYSVAANIVEGFARRYRGDRLKFLNTSESSLAEVGYCIHVAGRLGYITAQKVAELEAEIVRIAELEHVRVLVVLDGDRIEIVAAKIDLALRAHASDLHPGILIASCQGGCA